MRLIFKKYRNLNVLLTCIDFGYSFICMSSIVIISSLMCIVFVFFNSILHWPLFHKRIFEWRIFLRIKPSIRNWLERCNGSIWFFSVGLWICVISYDYSLDLALNGWIVRKLFILPFFMSILSYNINLLTIVWRLRIMGWTVNKRLLGCILNELLLSNSSLWWDHGGLMCMMRKVSDYSDHSLLRMTTFYNNIFLCVFFLMLWIVFRRYVFKPLSFLLRSIIFT